MPAAIFPLKNARGSLEGKNREAFILKYAVESAKTILTFQRPIRVFKGGNRCSDLARYILERKIQKI